MIQELSDLKYEMFGPRADKLLIKLYLDAISEWETGLETGEIDVTDALLDEAHKNEYLSPLWNAKIMVVETPSGSKATSRTYTGTPDVTDNEDPWEGSHWEGFVNDTGYDVDNFLSFMNMHPGSGEFGNDADMTIRYGFATPTIGTLNPIYASSQSDNTLIDLIGCSSLLIPHPEDGFAEDWNTWAALQYSAKYYMHPVYGNCSKVSFTLRPGIEWSDGTPVTTADVYFSFVELADILEARSFPPPSWVSNVQDILSFKLLDALNFEVLLDAVSGSAVSRIGQTRILPKHIWKPIYTTGDPTTFAPDPNLINSGAWRLKEYVENDHMLLVANKPGTTVQTNLPGSTPMTSNMGFFRYYPVIEEPRDSSYYYYKIRRSKTDPITIRPFNFTFRNEAQVPMTISYTITGEYPDGSPILGLPSATNVIMPAISTMLVPWSTSMLYGLWRFHVEISEDMWINGNLVKTFHWYWCNTAYWITINEDIAGSTWYDDVDLNTYPYKAELSTPDIKVDIQDDARALAAFGSYPGHPMWNVGLAEINGDYKIDIKDLARISAKFGWHP